jgi:hypothetical protein
MGIIITLLAYLLLSSFKLRKNHNITFERLRQQAEEVERKKEKLNQEKREFEKYVSDCKESQILQNNNNSTYVHEVIIYIIAHSTPEHFSKSKLNNYIIMVNMKYPLGLTIIRGRYNFYIKELDSYFNDLFKSRLVSVEKIPVKTGNGFRNVYRALNSFQKYEISNEIKYYIDSLIQKWDTQRSKRMECVLRPQMGNRGERRTHVKL